MNYNSWRISYQSSESAARAAYNNYSVLMGENAVLRSILANSRQVLLTIEADNSDESESLRALLDTIERAINPSETGLF